MSASLSQTFLIRFFSSAAWGQSGAKLLVSVCAAGVEGCVIGKNLLLPSAAETLLIVAKTRARAKVEGWLDLSTEESKMTLRGGDATAWTEPYFPFLTWRFNVALQFAAGLHHAQARKGVAIPYIAHLMAVCALVLEAGGDEDQAIAALLHDAVEDQGGLPTLETIRHLLGERVANAVESCSDSIASDPKKKLPWRERKEKYLAHLRSTKNEDTLLIAVADKLHNARATLSDYRALNDEIWRRFNAPKEDQLWYYGELVETLRGTTAPTALVDELRRVVEELKQLAN